MAFANEAQKQQWLVPLAKGEMLGAFCLTEPHAGSDASALRTTARRDGDSYVLDGVKQFITSGKNGHVAIVMAVTDKAAGKRGISAFLVPTKTPGYVVARLEVGRPESLPAPVGDLDRHSTRRQVDQVAARVAASRAGRAAHRGRSPARSRR